MFVNWNCTALWYLDWQASNDLMYNVQYSHNITDLWFISFQITLIREKSEKLKERVYEYERAVTNQIEDDSSLLMTKKEQLEESYTKVHKWLRDSHVTELISQRQQMSEELERETDVEVDKWELRSKPVIINRGIFYDK